MTEYGESGQSSIKQCGLNERMDKLKKLYFAAPLFSEAEQLYNEQVVTLIESIFKNSVEVYLPQRNDSINDKSQYADSVMIANGDNAYLEDADILIALLDGTAMDPGVAAEVGYFYSMNKPIIGIYTDSRQGSYGNQEKLNALDELAESQFSYVNLYVVGLIKQRGLIVSHSNQAIDALAELILD